MGGVAVPAVGEHDERQRAGRPHRAQDVGHQHPAGHGRDVTPGPRIPGRVGEGGRLALDRIRRLRLGRGRRGRRRSGGLTRGGRTVTGPRRGARSRARPTVQHAGADQHGGDDDDRRGDGTETAGHPAPSTEPRRPLDPALAVHGLARTHLSPERNRCPGPPRARSGAEVRAQRRSGGTTPCLPR